MIDQICTKEKPYNKETDTGRWQHPDAVEISERDRDCSTYVTYKCPNCGLEFECELPD